MTKKYPAKQFREALRPYNIPKINETSTDSEADIALLESLEYEYEKEKSRLSNLLSDKDPDSVIKSERIGLFLFSVGLFAFGRLDVAQDIMDNIPRSNVRLKGFADVLIKLLPTPQNLDPLNDTATVREWLEVKLSKLRWDEGSGRYILENFRILPRVYNDSNLEHRATNSRVDREGLVVEIQPDTGSNWVGNFHPGQSDFSNVYQHPNSIDLIIVSRGQGYIINPESRQLLETFGGCIFSVIDLPETYYILFQDASSLLCYDSSGFLWQNTEIAWDSLRGIKVDGNILSGEFHRSKEDVWASFWLNLKTGSVHKGEYSLPLTKPTRPWWQLW